MPARSDNDSPEAPAWVYWLFKHGLKTIVLVFLLGVLLIASLTYWLDRRLEHLEERIAEKPPKSYTPPNLDDYAAEPIDDADIAQRHSDYVPVYSHVYFDGGRPFLLEATLSIRNTSETASVYIESVRYFDTHGELVKEPVTNTIQLKPLQTIEFVVPQKDSTGGSGANYLVDWFSTDPAVAPLIEVVMVGNEGTHAIAFRAESVRVTP
ncbi:DUF3124 domain-containing protein [Aeoliella mucimassa]|uniref:DUF3124 domain-containing protein n=1 Tax=Aeoliella mucimassa TaxID=2527972 RepID=A0A518ARU8_9BACT|nr:DUF3124 domain-containing protein [Aeoliella mucimassa]QDU57453.1 hypothetical protein Pan181_36690 [Aeoliella mucimassa]